MSLWMDARLLIMFGGLLASVGLILSAFSPNIWLIYFGCYLAGKSFRDELGGCFLNIVNKKTVLVSA